MGKNGYFWLKGYQKRYLIFIFNFWRFGATIFIFGKMLKLIF
jgi:hypothetical protein